MYNTCTVYLYWCFAGHVADQLTTPTHYHDDADDADDGGGQASVVETVVICK